MATSETAPRLVFRTAREEDAAAIREIFNQAVEDHLATFEAEPRSLEEQRCLIAEAAANPKFLLLVAELRGWVLGWITIQPWDRPAALDGIGELSLYVLRSFRQYGVGKQLMQHAQKEAQSLGYRKLLGHVLAGSRESLALCRSTGWREVGRLEKHVRAGEQCRDVVLVEYLVPPGPPAPPSSHLSPAEV